MFMQGERATGYGVALMTTLFGSLSNNSLIKSIAPPFSEIETDEQASKKRKIES